jgi:Protein of unknown function (DUF2959)
VKKAVLMVALVLTLVGCSTTAPDRSARTASRLDKLQQDSLKARQQTGSVQNSLDALMNATPERLRAAYDRYAGDVTKMKEYAAAIREDDTDLQKNGASYLSKWQKDASSISNTELRQMAEQRRNEIAEKFKGMTAAYSAAAQSFDAFLRDIDDVRKVIGNDLTPTGQAGVHNTAVVQNVKPEASQVSTAIEAAERAIADFRAQITPTAK